MKLHRRIVGFIFVFVLAAVGFSWTMIGREMLAAGKFFFFMEQLGFTRFSFAIHPENLGILQTHLIAAISMSVMGIVFSAFLLAEPRKYWHEACRFFLFLFFVSFQSQLLHVWSWVMVVAQAPESDIVLVMRGAFIVRICGDVFLFVSTIYWYSIRQRAYGTLALVLLLVLARFLTLLPIDLIQLDLARPYSLENFWTIDSVSLLVTAVTIIAYLQLSFRNNQPRRWGYATGIILMILARQLLVYGENLLLIGVAAGILVAVAPIIYVVTKRMPFFLRSSR